MNNAAKTTVRNWAQIARNKFETRFPGKKVHRKGKTNGPFAVVTACGSISFRLLADGEEAFAAVRRPCWKRCRARYRSMNHRVINLAEEN